MKRPIQQGVRRLLQRVGYDVIRHQPEARIDPRADLPALSRRVIERVAPYTMTSPERIHALVEAVQYLVRAERTGAFVECGVWRGGSTMAMIEALQAEGRTDRDLYLYDTFEGMSAPTEEDVSIRGEPAWKKFLARQTSTDRADWCAASLDEVRTNTGRTGYPAERLHYIEGKVEDTLPAHAPEQIALLRLDTDWYASTKHELEHLYPRLVPGGILIIDDYGHWEGARRAVDEYLQTLGYPVLLHRIDYTGRMLIKPMV